MLIKFCRIFGLYSPNHCAVLFISQKIIELEGDLLFVAFEWKHSKYLNINEFTTYSIKIQVKIKILLTAMQSNSIKSSGIFKNWYTVFEIMTMPTTSEIIPQLSFGLTSSKKQANTTSVFINILNAEIWNEIDLPFHSKFACSFCFVLQLINK